MISLEFLRKDFYGIQINAIMTVLEHAQVLIFLIAHNANVIADWQIQAVVHLKKLTINVNVLVQSICKNLLTMTNQSKDGITKNVFLNASLICQEFQRMVLHGIQILAFMIALEHAQVPLFLIAHAVNVIAD